MKNDYDSYSMGLWREYRLHSLGMTSLYVVLLFALIAVYAPFLASSKPFVVYYDGAWYFPLFRYLFYIGFFTKRLDIFFNLLIFTLPLALGCFYLFKQRPRILKVSLSLLLLGQTLFFLYFAYGSPRDPAADSQLIQERQMEMERQSKVGRIIPDWNFDLRYMTPYQKLNLILHYQQIMAQNLRLSPYAATYAQEAKKHGRIEKMPTLWQWEIQNEQSEIDRQKKVIASSPKGSQEYHLAESMIRYVMERREWLEKQSSQLSWELMPFFRPFHWEDDAAGEQSLNQYVGWTELTRINRKDLSAALIFGVRISLIVGIVSVALALLIGIPVGALAGFYGGTLDIVVCRLLEIWESMPTFFMLLLVVAITQSKSIFLVIGIIGFFGWSGFSRYIRGEFFKQRNLAYVEACRAVGFKDRMIMFSHILPNAIPPLLTLLPFAVMGAITSEAGLSFLGLGEEGSCSWGVLMDEGRTAFPGESYLLWPPAIMLTILLVAIALVGDTMRDVLDPKLRKA